MTESIKGAIIARLYNAIEVLEKADAADTERMLYALEMLDDLSMHGKRYLILSEIPETLC